MWQIKYYNLKERRKAFEALLIYEKLPFTIQFDSSESFIISNLSISLDTVLSFLNRYGYITSFKPVKYNDEHEFVDASYFPIKFGNNQINYKEFYPSGLYSDATIIVNRGHFPVHKMFLSAISDFFADLFHSGDIVEIHDIDNKTFNDLLYFLYGHSLYQEGIKSLRMFLLARQLLVRNFDLENAILSVTIKKSHFEEYIEILSSLYPDDSIPNAVVYHLAKTLGKEYIELVPTQWYHQVQNLLHYMRR